MSNAKLIIEQSDFPDLDIKRRKVSEILDKEIAEETWLKKELLRLMYEEMESSKQKL